MKILSKIKSIFTKIRASNLVRLLVIAKKLNNRYSIVQIRKEREIVHACLLRAKRALSKSTGLMSHVFCWRRKDNKIIENEIKKCVKQLNELEDEFQYYKTTYCSNPVKRRALDIYQIGLKEILVTSLYALYILSIIPRLIFTNLDFQDTYMEVYSVSILFALFYFSSKVVRRKNDN